MKKILKRAAFLEKAALLPVLAVILDRAAQAQAKSSKDAMHYQSSPNNGMQCAGCKFFSPGKDANSDGSCAIVDGNISPHGYCIAYNAKS